MEQASACHFGRQWPTKAQVDLGLGRLGPKPFSAHSSLPNQAMNHRLLLDCSSHHPALDRSSLDLSCPGPPFAGPPIWPLLGQGSRRTSLEAKVVNFGSFW